MDAKRKLIKLKVRVVMTENEFQKPKSSLKGLARTLGALVKQKIGQRWPSRH